MHELRYGNKTVIVNDQCFWIIYTVYYKSHAVYRRTFANCACRICIIQIVSSTFGMIQVLRYNHIYPFRPSPTTVLYCMCFCSGKGQKIRPRGALGLKAKNLFSVFLFFRLSRVVLGVPWAESAGVRVVLRPGRLAERRGVRPWLWHRFLQSRRRLPR